MPPITQVLLLLVVIPAAFFDIRQRRIPNWLVLAGLVAGIGLNTFLFYDTPSPVSGLWFALQGLGIAFLVYFPLYLLRGMGAGDVKLMGAVGAIVGWKAWLFVLFFTSILGGLTAVLIVVSKGRIYHTLQNIGVILTSIRYRQAPYTGNPELDVGTDEGVRMPHGVIIALGVIGYVVARTFWP